MWFVFCFFFFILIFPLRLRAFAVRFFSFATSYVLNSIHKCGFNAVENDGPYYYHHNHEAEGVEEVHGVEGAGPQECISKGFDNGGHGVGLDEGLEAGGDGGDRVDDRGGVHKELDAELHQEAQVAVFGSEGRDDDAKSEAEAGHHEDEYR